MTTITVHIAGPMEDSGLQVCSRCGAVLIDYRGPAGTVMVAGPPSVRALNFWPEGGFIGMAGNGSVLMNQDASCIDEIACWNSTQ